MNQDDSIITPGQDAAGKNLFEVGDYRYAANARIGSSRTDNFGDLENIRDRVEVDNYYALQQILQNGDFNSGLTSWLQLDEGASFRTWIFSGQYARLQVVPDSTAPTTNFPISNFTIAYDTDQWPTSQFTQANFLQADQFTVGQAVVFDGSTYTGGIVVAVGGSYIVFQTTFQGDEGGVNIEGPDGPPYYVPTAFISKVFYQTSASIASLTVRLKFYISINVAVTDGSLNLVYLNGTTILSEVPLDTGNIGSLNYNQEITIPANCDGIGIRLSGTVVEEMTADLQFFTLESFAFSQGTRPAGNEKVIGRYEDYEFQRLYYCVYNDQGNHCIRYWDAVNNHIVEVLQWSGLNWLSTTYVKLAKLDNWMAFTDRRNPPRLIDVDTISQLKATLDAEFREFHISFHKWAPTVPAIPRVYYDTVTNNYEKLKNKVYHFSYRYIYYGNLKSRWSPISKGATVGRAGDFYGARILTSIEVDIPGCIYDDPSDTTTAYNYFGHTDIKFTQAVKSIELAFRDGETELWKLWKRVDVNPAFNRFQYFNGDGYLTPLPQDDFEQLFDSVPFLAGTVEAIDNRFVFADCLDEQPPVTDMQIDDVESIVGIDSWGESSPSQFPQFATTPREKLLRLNQLSNLTFKDRSLYKVGLQFLYPSGWRTAVYTTENWLYKISDIGGYDSGIQRTAFNFKIPDIFKPPVGAVGYQLMRTNSLNIDYYMFGIVNKFIPIIDDVSTILDQVEIPEDVKNRIRQHFENNRTVSGDDLTAEIEKETQAVIDADNAKINRRKKRLKRWTRVGNIANAVFADPIAIGFRTLQNKTVNKWLSNNSIAGKLQQELRKTKEINLIADASRICIDISNWYFGAKETATKEYPLNKLFYNFREGDRVRFVGATVTNPTVNQLQEFDVPIIEYTGKAIIIERPADLLWVSKIDTASPRNFNIEVYTPKTAISDDHVFYETGEWYPILYPGTGDRDFAKRDFTFTNNASVTLTQAGPFDIFNKMPFFYGDSYFVLKTVYRDKTLGPGSAESPMFTSMNPDQDETFGYWDHNNGRAAIAYDDLPVVRFKQTQARFGGKIVEESFVNNLNNMREQDQFVYPSEYGRIRDLVNTSNAQVESVGAILLAIGEREAWSIYVGRTTLEDLSGRTQVALADDILGSFNTLLGSHGTLNPESVCKNRGRVWWWNALDGSWIRYGRDGLTEISEYKMRNWFAELGDMVITKYQTDELPVVLAEFDNFNKEVVTYQNHSSLPSTFRGYPIYKGALFSETDTRWKSTHSFTPEMMGKMNNQMVMFQGGSVFLYEKAETYLTDVYWEPVFNDGPALKKVWQAFSITATNKWSVERILSEYRGLKTKQQTTIPMTSFVEKEDNYYAPIPRDVNTPNVSNPKIEGDMMRSKAIQVLMKLDPSVDYLSLLHYVNAELADSPKNP